MNNAPTDHVDVFAPLMIDLRIATVATDAFTTRVRTIMATAGVEPAKSYVAGTLIAVIAASRIAFDDATVQTLLDAQMALEMPDEPDDSGRRH